MVRQVQKLLAGLTVRQHFGLAAGLLCLGMVAVLATGTAFVGHRLTDRLVRHELAELADTMMDSLHRGMFERFRELQLLARMEANAELLSADPDRTQRIIEHMQATFRDYAWIGLAHSDGIVRAATQDRLEGVSVTAQDWFQKGLSGPALDDVRSHAHLADTTSGAAPRVVSVSVPVHRADGTLLGVIGAHIDWQWADALRRDFLAPKHDGADTEIWVVSKDGIVLLGSEPGRQAFTRAQMAAMQAQRSGTVIDDHTGTPFLTGYAVEASSAGYPGLGWMAIARRKADLAFQPVSTIVWTITGLGLVMAMIGGLLALAVARRVAAPIQELAMAAKRIGRDPNTTMFPRVVGPREVAQLSAVLRHLLCRIGFAEQRTVEAESRAETETRRLEESIDSLRRLADTDPLTGLLNRRALLGHADRIARLPGQRLGVLMIDIDHFKKINDRCGHIAGDAVIRAVAATIAANVRKSDTVARFGGEEFIVLMPDTDLPELEAIAERVRSAVHETPVAHEHERIAVTASCGAALMAEADADVRDLVQRADAALYAAKEGGRNRVCMAPAAAAKVA